MAHDSNKMEKRRSNSANDIDILVHDKFRSQDPALQLEWPYMPLLPPNLQLEANDVKRLYGKEKRVLKTWIRWDNRVKMFARFFMALTLIAAAVIGVIAGVKVSPALSYVTAGLAATGALREPLEKLFIDDLTTKKRIKYMTKCSIIRECLNAVYLQYLIAKEDKEIDNEEAKQYQKHINDMYVKLFSIDAEYIV